MGRSMFVIIAAALVASVVSVGSGSAMPIDGAAIAKAASTNHLSQEVYWHRWGYRRGPCLNSPAHC